MEDLGLPKKDNPRGFIVLISMLAIVGLLGIFYRFKIVPSEGYRYTTVLVVKKCYTLIRGNGYVLRYIAEGQVIQTRCDPSEMDLTEGKKYLMRYAKINPKYYRVLDFELIDSVNAPSAGWTTIPKEHFRRLSID